MLNGIITFDWWLPAPAMRSRASWSSSKKYQSRAGGEGVDPLGYYLGPWAYARMQVLGDAIEATKSLDQQKIADYIRNNTFNTVVGDVKFGKKGEWDKARILTVQFQNISGTSVDDFRGGKGEVVVWPERVQGRRRDPAVHGSQGEIAQPPIRGRTPPALRPLSRQSKGNSLPQGIVFVRPRTASVLFR